MEKEKKLNLFCILLMIAYVGLLYAEKSMAGGNSQRPLLFLQNSLVSVYGLFFMVAGIWFFERYEGNLFRYYVITGLKIIVPLFVGSWILLASKIGFSISFTYLMDIGKGFLFRSVSEDYWMFYTMIGLFLVAPFFKRMTEGLSEKEKRSLLLLLVGYFTFFVCGVLFNIKITLTGYPFLNWIAYALAGVLVSKIEWKNKERRWIYILGVIAFVVSSLEALFLTGKNWSLDSYCLTRILICMALFLWAGTGRKLPAPWLQYILYGVCLLIPLLTGNIV